MGANRCEQIMAQTTGTEKQLEHNQPSLWRFHVGQWVEVITQRPNVEQYHRAVGQVTTITNNDIIYIAIGRHKPCFHPHELRPMPTSEGQAA